MSLDILKSCVNGFDSLAQSAAEAMDAKNTSDTAYNIKALTFDASTVLGIAAVALTVFGVLNPLAGLALVVLSLLGRTVTQQSMSANERGFAQIFNSNIPIPLSNRALATIGNQVLFYDTTPSIGDLFTSAQQEEIVRHC